MQLLGAIRILLYSEGYTIKGVQRILKEQGVRAVVAASQGSVRGARVLSLSERRARGAAPEYLVEVPLEDGSADDPGPQDEFFETAPTAPRPRANCREKQPACRSKTDIAWRPFSPSERMRKSFEGRGARISRSFEGFSAFFQERRCNLGKACL